MSTSPRPTLAERLDQVEADYAMVGKLLEVRRKFGPELIAGACLDAAAGVLQLDARRAAEDILARFPEGRAFPLITHRGRGYFADALTGRPTLNRFDLVEASSLP